MPQYYLMLILLTNLFDLPAEYAGIPLLDIDSLSSSQTIVDRESQKYLGHPTTVMLEDQKTILAVYPQGHGKGQIIFKRSRDGGKSWSERLRVPDNWATSKETPTIHRVVDAQGKKRLIVFSGLYPARMAVSEDDGETWSSLNPVGDWGGIVVMSSLIALKTPGHYLGLFHDDGRFIRKDGKSDGVMTLYQVQSIDGGMTWSAPKAIFSSRDVHLCEPGAICSPDQKEIAVLLRENRRVKESQIIFSSDEGKSWTEPRELPRALTGDRHTAKYTNDGRLFISYRDTATDSPTKGDWLGWVGTYEDLKNNRPGQYRVRIKDNKHSWDCAYPGVERLPDGTMLVVTYGHWIAGESPFILAVHVNLRDLEASLKKR